MLTKKKPKEKYEGEPIDLPKFFLKYLYANHQKDLFPSGHKSDYWVNFYGRIYYYCVKTKDKEFIEKITNLYNNYMEKNNGTRL